MLKRDGSALGTEQGFYVKTDVEPTLQEAMHHALVHRSALLENLMVDAKGKVDFLDERLGENGRGVLDRRQLKVRRGGRLVSICADSLDLPPLEQLDGLVFAFITRRNTVYPFAHRLTPEQGVLAYLWGESSHSFATVPEKAGESVRIVGMDDFIIGNQGRKVNAFHDIVMDLAARFPGKVHFFQYNTGGVGEIIEVDKGSGARKLIRKATRVPIDVMAALQRGDLRGTNEYRKGALSMDEVVRFDGGDLSAYDPANFYSKEQIAAYLAELVEGRRKHTEEIAAQGLRKDIRDLAHRELDQIEAIAGKRKAEAWAPSEPAADREAAEDRAPLSRWITSWEPKRPGRESRFGSKAEAARPGRPGLPRLEIPRPGSPSRHAAALRGESRRAALLRFSRGRPGKRRPRENRAASGRTRTRDFESGLAHPRFVGGDLAHLRALELDPLDREALERELDVARRVDVAGVARPLDDLPHDQVVREEQVARQAVVGGIGARVREEEEAPAVLHDAAQLSAVLREAIGRDEVHDLPGQDQVEELRGLVEAERRPPRREARPGAARGSEEAARYPRRGRARRGPRGRRRNPRRADRGRGSRASLPGTRARERAPGRRTDAPPGRSPAPPVRRTPVRRLLSPVASGTPADPPPAGSRRRRPGRRASAAWAHPASCPCRCFP